MSIVYNPCLHGIMSGGRDGADYTKKGSFVLVFFQFLGNAKWRFAERKICISSTKTPTVWYSNTCTIEKVLFSHCRQLFFHINYICKHACKANDSELTSCVYWIHALRYQCQGQTPNNTFNALCCNPFVWERDVFSITSPFSSLYNTLKLIHA